MNLIEKSCIVCNPPYFKVSDEKQLNHREPIANARHEAKLTLDALLKKASELLNGINEYHSTEEIKIPISDDKKFGIINEVEKYVKKNSEDKKKARSKRVLVDEAWMLLAYGGVTLKNLLLLAMTAVIIFVPLLKKYGIGAKNSKK